VNVPIYQTTTFLFESADEVRRDQEGAARKYLYSRYANPRRSDWLQALGSGREGSRLVALGPCGSRREPNV